MAPEGKVLSGKPLVQQLELIQTGRARTFLADDVASHLASIELSKEDYPSPFTLVTKLWTRVPAPDDLSILRTNSTLCLVNRLPRRCTQPLWPSQTIAIPFVSTFNLF